MQLRRAAGDVAFVDRLRACSHTTIAYIEVPCAQHEFDALASVRTASIVNGVEHFLTKTYNDHPSAPHAPPNSERSPNPASTIK